MKLLLATTFLATLTLPAFADEAQRVGVVGLAAGAVTGIENGTPHALKTGDALYLGEVVKTQAGGQAQLIFLDRSTLTLKANSDVTIDRFVFDPASASGDLGLKSAEGAFRFVGGILSKKKPVTIATPVGTIGIRGGIVDATVSPTGGADAVFVYGEALSLTNAAGITSTTKTYGSGFGLASATALPTALDHAAVLTQLDGYRSTPNLPGTGGASASEVGGKLDLNTESREPQPAAGHVAPTASAVSPANGADSAPAFVAATTTAEANPVLAATAPSTGALAGVKPAEIGTIAATTQTDRSVRDGTLRDRVAAALDTATPATTAPARPTVAIIPAGAPATTVAISTDRPSVAASGGAGTTASGPVFYGRYTQLDITAATFENGEGTSASNGNTLHFNGVDSNNSTNRHSADLAFTPADSSDHVTNAGSVMLDGDAYTQTEFTSANGDMRYFLLQNALEDVRILTGKSLTDGNAPASALAAARAASIQRSATEGTGDVSYYRFLPDLRSTATNPGIFAGTFAPATASSGVAVDWNAGSFVTGKVAFDSMLGAPGVTTAYGGVSNIGPGGKYLNGNVLTLSGPNAGDTLGSTYAGPNTVAATSAGTVSTGRDLYGSVVNGVNGLALDYTAGMKTGSAPAVRVASPTAVLSAGALDKTYGTSGLTLSGYAGGLLVSNANSTPVTSAYQSGSLGDASVTLSASQSTAKASINMMAASGGSTLNAEFGSPTDRTKSAYVSDSLWAAQQQSTAYNGPTVSSGTNLKGVLIPASQLSNVPAAAQCTGCAYTQWGVWASEARINGTSQLDVTPLVPVVVGQVTQNLGSSGLTGTVNYAGPAYANISLDGKLKNAVGQAASTVNLGTRTVTSQTIDFPVASLGTDSIHLQAPAGASISPTGAAQFSNIALSQVYRNGAAVGGASGSINGALYGPNAENIAGSYAVNSSSVKIGGIYQGSRPLP